ncbi:hypothetical protein [Sphaerotilus hippei]|nr:hypothetical protein [Sphaerotilus hippei]
MNSWILSLQLMLLLTLVLVIKGWRSWSGQGARRVASAAPRVDVALPDEPDADFPDTLIDWASFRLDTQFMEELRFSLFETDAEGSAQEPAPLTDWQEFGIPDAGVEPHDASPGSGDAALSCTIAAQVHERAWVPWVDRPVG